MKEDSNKPQLCAKDSARKVFRFFCAACWLAWVAVALLTAWALYVLRSGYVPFNHDEVITSFWWITYFCIGMPMILKMFLYWLENRT